MPPSLRGLREAVSGEVVDDPAVMEGFGRDASHLRGRALAVVRPRDSEDLVRLVRWARSERVPLVARGGGTSLDGESVPFPAAVVVDLTRWDALHEVNPVDRTARVGPGLINFELHRTLRERGLFFPPNPGSWTSSTIGGNVATNASGPRAYKYGSTRAWVRAAEVVLGTGERLSLGGRTTKRSVGPDLLSLFVGSEGTLGIFTELTLALAPLPPRRLGIIVPLPNGASVGTVVQRIVAPSSTPLSAIEFLDAASAGSLASEAGSRFPADRALLLLEVESANAEEEEQALSRLLRTLEGAGIREEPNVVGDADGLWTLRGKSGTALDRRMGERIREDVAVPLTRLDELFSLVERIRRAHAVDVAVFGHVGDANLHPNFAVDPSTEEAEAIRRELLVGVRQLDGTISAEHGIGRLKAPYLPLELSAPALAIERALKAVCDPDGLLNPGKLWLPPLEGAQ